MLCSLANTVVAQEYNIVITGDFESQCILPNEGGFIYDELPQVMVACRDRQVTYTAWYSGNGDNAVNWSWTVNGAASYSASGNVVQVTWGSGTSGELGVVVTTASGRELAHYQLVTLVENPVASATSVPACSTDHVIYVCSGESVEFTDQSHVESSDIAGYYWSGCGATASTHSFTLENVTADCHVTHRVYNNCGCYDEEIYYVYVLDGDPLRIDCYGTACEGSTVTYTATSPACDDYLWAVEGGTVVDGQHSPEFTVLWDNPHDGYGVISLDGTACEGACQNKLSVKIPIIQNGMHISGQTSACVGEAVVYSVPLYGSTQYDWTITPSILPVLINNANQIEYKFLVADTYYISVNYKCDFLSCGTFYSDTLTVVVRPRLSIEGEDEICISNACSLYTLPTATAIWEITDLGNNQTVYTSASPEAAVSTTFNQAGRYRVTAQNSGYCNEAEFFLTVKGTPPAPTVLEMDEENPTVACLNSSILLKAHPGNPDYSIIWEPVCQLATPQSFMGDEATITYSTQVCNVQAYTYDLRLQCRSSGYYTHTVSQFQLENVSINSPITVCPGSEIVWNSSNVPYQDGVIYEWLIEDNYQYCAAVEGSKYSNAVTLKISDFDPLPSVLPHFNVYLVRTSCSGIKDTTTINVTIADLSATQLSISAPDICQNQSAVFTGSGCSSGNYSWHFSDSPTVSHGAQVQHTFTEAGTAFVELTCNPYSYCTKPSYLPHKLEGVVVNPVPPVLSIGYDGSNVYTIPALSTSDYSFSWMHNPTNSNSVPAPPVGNLYSCLVTSLTYPYCSIRLGGEVRVCSPMTIEQVGTINYCNGTVTFRALSPTSSVVWEISGGSHGSPEYSGTHNEIITFPVTSVGNFYITATTTSTNCQTGSLAFTVDFLPIFTFEQHCTSVVIHNKSKYLDGTKLATISVNGLALPSFPASQSTVPFSSGISGSYNFVLTGYDGHTLNCPLKSLYIPNSYYSPVTIETANTGNMTNTCDNTPIELTATMSFPHTVVSSHWTFGDHSTCLDVNGGSVFHTFAQMTYPYNVNVSIIDGNGCVSNGSINITSSNNILKDEQLIIQQGSPITCPGNNRTIEYQANGSAPLSATYNWSTPPSPSNSNTHFVTHTDDYSVVVTNNNYCRTEASVNVPFRNSPTAIIIIPKYYYCSGETIELRSQPYNSNYQYQWTVANSVTSIMDNYNTQTVSFNAPNYQCQLTVTLTVTDGSTNCPATADPVTLYVTPAPSAPTIDISSTNYCIHNPPVEMVCSAPSSGVHWSNGAYGTTAYYHYPGPVTAYYYDLTTGCRSDMASFHIPSEPDFDALLTGCYKICPELAEGTLPIYGLLPVWQNDYSWEWLFEEGNDHDYGPDPNNPDILQLHGYDTYWLDVNYYNDCHVESKPLVLEKDTICKCNGIDVSYKYTCKLDDCKLIYNIRVKVCNNTDDNVCFNIIRPLFDAGSNITITDNTFSPMTILPDDCEYFDISLSVSELPPVAVTFQLIDDECADCDKIFGINLTPNITDLDPDCMEKITEGNVIIHSGLTDISTLYYTFMLDLSNAGTSPAVIAVWSEPSGIIDYTFDGTNVSGIGFMDRGTFNNNDEVCIYVIVCDGSSTCVWKYCFHPDEMERRENGETSSEDDDAPKAINGIPRYSEPVLQPNPTTGDVNVVGTADEVEEILVMDMHGRKAASFDGTARFNIATLSSGMYIVRIKTRSTDGTEHTTYLSLVKK